MSQEMHQQPSLTQKVVHGGLWVVALKAATRGAGLLSIFVIARVLSPEDFGLFGIALLALGLLETFSQTGFDQALVQQKEEITSYLDTAWVVSLIRGAILCTIIYLSAPLVAAFFNSPKSIQILQVLSLSPLIFGARNPGIVFFQKELDFKKRFFFQISGTIAYVTVGVTLALYLRNVWALVFAQLAKQLAIAVLSYFFHPYRPSLYFNLQKAKTLFTFGKWVFGTGIILYFITQGDNAMVGKMLGTTALGMYAMAYKISNLPATEISHLISGVMFPAYAKLQDNQTGLRDAYFSTFQVLTFFSIPLAGGLFAFAPEFTKLVLGQKWEPIIPLIQILALMGLFRSLSASTGPLFQGVGKPDIITKIVLARLVILAVLIYPFTLKWKAPGTAFAVLLSGLLIDPASIFLAAKISTARLSRLLQSLIIPICSTIVTLFFLLAIKPAFAETIGFARILHFGAFRCRLLHVH